MATPIPFGNSVPFIEHLGMRLMRWEEGASGIEFDPKPEHLNSLGVTHGGALMTLLDVTLARACRSPSDEVQVVTIELKTNFMRAAAGPLRGEGRLLHRTATLAFAEGTVYDAAGKACAHATGTFKYVGKLPEQARAERRGPAQER